MWFDRNTHRFQSQSSTLVRLSDDTDGEAVFRIRRDDEAHQVVVTLCYSTFGGATSLMEGRSINFIEGAGLAYYHLMMVSCDPRSDRSKIMLKFENDVSDEISSNLKVKRHEVVFGHRTSKGDGLCVLVDKDDITVMPKVFFYEKIVPLIELRMDTGKKRARPRGQSRAGKPGTRGRS